MYKNNAISDWKYSSKFGFEKEDKIFLHTAFHGDFWEGITTF